MIIETKYGRLQGVKQYESILFKGVPYARPPVGEYRFQRPVEPKKWEGIRDASHWGSSCLQREQQKGSFYQKEFYDDAAFTTVQSEDCLYLNIWLPLEIEELIQKGERLPVAVYVHGGAFMGGAGSNLPFVATKLVKEGVILVTINYRLGVWGFLSHPLLALHGRESSWGNYGLWDQLAAIKWVKENIGAFGGDGDNITLFAQSAGAMSLQILALSDLSKGLYKRMILQSGGGYQNPLVSFKTREEASLYGEWLLEEIGKKKGISPRDRKVMKEYLLEGDAEEIQSLSLEVVGRGFREGVGFVFVPVIDGILLKEDGNILMEKGRFHRTPYILGANKNDLTMEKATDFSPESNPMEAANIAFARMANKEGADAYVYYFEHKLPGDDSGAFHSAELWYVFGSLDYSWRKAFYTERDYSLSKEMIRYWTEFMKTGNPNHEGSERWDPCTEKEGFIKRFG